MTHEHDTRTRTALVTGGSQGLGLALVTALIDDGWRVLTTARNADLLDQATRNLGTGVHAPAGDITDPVHRQRLTDAVGDRLDLLVNNASTLGPTPLPRLTDVQLDDVRSVLETNVVAPLALIQLLVPALRAASGTVVNISSDAAVGAWEGWGAYGASKAMLDQLTAVLSAEEPDLHVYAFDPGDMRTTMQADAFPGEDISDRPMAESVIPALRRLIDDRPPSSRYTRDGLVVA